MRVRERKIMPSNWILERRYEPKFIIEVIQFGYKLPLLQIPTPFTAKNNASALQESNFVENAINELISLDCITEVYEPPSLLTFVVSIQNLPKSDLF